MKVLFASSEMFPLIKTGGLGDVAYSLPQSLTELGADVRIVLPAYRDVLKKLATIRILGWLELWGAGRVHNVRILEARHPDVASMLLLVDCAALFDRPGNPYMHPDGYDWADNGERYTVFARAVSELARDALQLGWKPDVVHAHDWQTGLVPAFVDSLSQRPRTVFTIHNMAYGGHFSQKTFNDLHLPHYWWSPEGVEFYQGLSMLKAGIVYADAITTVSPTYAREICTPEFGYGMDGLLRSRHYKLHGILNGIDEQIWNPLNDVYLAARYDYRNVVAGKRENKQAMLAHFGVHDAALLDVPIFGLVSRLVEQKGIDLILQVIPAILQETNACFCLAGAGQHHYEHRLKELAAQYPGRVLLYIGYDERLAHLIEAGCDMFLMPSRFEPCGLNQMYSLKYGTPPVVYFTGGLADTVVNANPSHIAAQQATGFVFYELTWQALLGTMRWGYHLFQQPEVWAGIQKAGMEQNFAWQRSAEEYLRLYA